MRPAILHFAKQFKLDPDDLQQDIEEKLLRTKRKYITGTATYNTWLNYVIRNHCIDITRKKENRQKFCTHKIHHSGNISPDYQTRQHIARLFWTLRKRWPRKRALNTRLLWMLMTGWKYTEMAEELKMNENTLKVKIHKLRIFLGDAK